MKYKCDKTTMNIKGSIIMPHVFLLEFDNQYDLAMTFVRLQEFYESPKFKGKYFTLEEYMDYWSKEFGRGSFTYPSVWAGFNIPGKVYEDWRNTLYSFEEGRPRELILMEVIRNLVFKEYGSRIHDASFNYNEIYIIGTYKRDDQRSLEHEVAHALYYLYPKYRKTCNKLINQLPKTMVNEASKKLLKMGYDKKVVKDEIQAYLSTELNGMSDVLQTRNEFVAHYKDFKESVD